MLETMLGYNQFITWKQIQYRYYSFMDYFKESYNPGELWSKVPLE